MSKVLEEKIVALEGMVGEMMEENASLKDRLEKLESPGDSVKVHKEEKLVPKVPEKTFPQGNKKYRFTVASFSLKGKKYISEEVLSDKEFLKTIVEKYPGLLEQVK